MLELCIQHKLLLSPAWSRGESPSEWTEKESQPQAWSRAPAQVGSAHPPLARQLVGSGLTTANVAATESKPQGSFLSLKFMGKNGAGVNGKE